ncbi:MAG: NADH-quinone oxidoreductase subunit M [Gammaproteobacteria bacterium]|nr:NADH-quinone oxidoreductase subunit M [Gammaproteobacteria bacterium]
MIAPVLIVILVLGGIAALLAEGRDARHPQRVALATLVLATGLFLPALAELLPLVPAGLPGVLADPSSPALFRVPWIERFGIQLLFVLDGLALLMVALTLVLGFVALAASWTEIRIRTGFYAASVLWTLAGVIGVFTALDLFLFFVFWEVMLVPMYFLIAIWGHEDRSAAAMKFFLFTQISGLLMLVSILALVFVHAAATGRITFDYFELLGTGFDPAVGRWILLGFLAAFLVKLPSVPFHTWLPDAHTDAPTGASVILAGILLKTGGYGLLRFVLPLFPEAAFELRVPLMTLGVISVLYGGVLAFAQTDFKRLVAYSSVAHMGFVLLGVFAWNQLALQGAVMQMVAHGLSSAALFMLAGMLQLRLHSREFARMGGLWMQAPRLGALALFFALAALGLPGLANFVGEFLVLLGSFGVDVPRTVLAALGMVLAAVYALAMMQRAFQGRSAEAATGPVADIGLREGATLVAVALGLVWLGLQPAVVLDVSAPFVDSLTGMLPGGSPTTSGGDP